MKINSWEALGRSSQLLAFFGLLRFYPAFIYPLFICCISLLAMPEIFIIPICDIFD